jgi:hypothetical protein
MSSVQETTYSSRTKIAYEGGSSALAAIYRRAIDRYDEVKKVGPETAPDDGNKFKEDSADAVRK